jgi:glycerol uptake facilitator protein
MAKNSYLGELIAEFLGTMILILFGVGVVAQVVTNPDGGMGDHDSIAWAWGIGVILGVYVAGRVSGAHINPAVTIALAAFKGFPWRKVAPYCLAQTAGAFVAAIIVRFVYADLIARIDPDHTIASQGIFSTLPGNAVEGANVTITTAFFDQIVQLYFWLPIVAPIIGGLIGGAAFKYLVERYLPAEAPEVTLEPTPSEPTPSEATATEPKQQS